MCAGSDNAMIPLSNLISIKETVAPKELNHFNQLRAATITAQLAPGYTLSDGLTFLEKAAQGGAARAPPISTTPARRANSRKQAPSMYLTFLLALAFIYLVLAAQFESFTDPVHHHADRAAFGHRRAAGAVVERRHAEHL